MKLSEKITKLRKINGMCKLAQKKLLTCAKK